MPKKFAGTNSKAVAAKAAKAEKADMEKAKKAQAEEDARWRDDDKSTAKKQSRKEDAEKKRLEALERKREKERLLAEEESAIKGKETAKAKKQQQPKVTRAMIQEQQASASKKKPNAAAEETHLTQEITENINRLQIEGEARNVDDAISVLGDEGEKVDMHPEKRMKAAYEEFEKERLPQLKAENGNLRLSQLKQMLRKEWMKSPMNPFNQKM